MIALLGCTPAKPELGDDSASPDDTATWGDDSAAPDCPSLGAEQAPAPAQLVGPLDPLVVTTDAEDGAWLTVSSLDGAVALSGELEVEVEGGLATFDGVEALGPGPLTLAVSASGCEVGLELGPVVVGYKLRYEPAFLPGARVGAAYTEWTGWQAVQTDALPPGLTLDEGLLSGLPEAEGAYELEAAAAEGEDVVRYGVQLPVFPSDDALADPPSDPSELGSFNSASLELDIPSVTTSRGTYTEIAVRVAFPTDDLDEPAPGPFPLVVFHHAAHSPAQIYDDYTELHGHWASHGYVVASVDSAVNVSASQSWENLTDMSSFQLAAMQLLLDTSADPSSPLYGRVDPDRIFVAGHSRGGGASLISLWREPSLAGALCFEQVSPLQTPSQDWDDPDGNGDRLLPERPVLFLAAGDDLDEPWPLPVSSTEQVTGPMVFVTLMGTNHEWTYDEDTPGGVTSASDISFDERHNLDQAYSTAFLERFARADLRWESSLFGLDALSSDLSGRGVSAHTRRHLDTELTIDDFTGEDGENLLGGANTGRELDPNENGAPYTDGLVAAGRGTTQIARIDARTPARSLGWTEDAALRFALTPDGEALDWSDQRALTFRASARCDPPPEDCEDVSPGVEVAVIDADGAEGVLDAEVGLGALGVVGREWAQVILPLDAFLPVDLSRVVAMELRFAGGTAPEDDLWVDELRVE